MQGLNFEQAVGHSLSRGRDANDKLPLRGRFKVEVVDKDGNVKHTDEFNNDIVNQGKNDLFDIMFHDGTQIASSSWFIGLISLASYSALAAADTMSSHSGWIELTGYSQATRVAWGPGASSSQSITNASAATFDINASGTVKGIFVTSNSTKGGTTGRLWATALFSADVPVSNGDQLRVTYTVSA
jgi:hypothetical protein